MSRRLLLASPPVVVLAVVARVVLGWEPPPDPAHADRCVAGEAIPTLESTVLAESPALAIPTRLELVGDYLVVLDAAADSVLHVVDRHSGALVRSLGRRGRGPGEFWGAWALDAARDGESAVWVYDASLRRLTYVPLGPDAASRPWLAKMVQLDDGRLVVEPRWLDAEQILGAGLLSDARFALYDASGRPAGNLGQPAVVPGSGNPIQSGQARLALRPGGNMAVLANRYASTLEVLSLAGSTITSVQGPVAVQSVGEPISVDLFAYVDVTATAGAIVALFSGRDSRVHGARAPFGRCLHVFDWEGSFTTAFSLDADVIAIATDPAGRFVYGLRHDPVPAVIRFSLPPAVPSRAIASRAAGDGGVRTGSAGRR